MTASPEREARPRHTQWAWLVATFFGVGTLRPGPGTYGSVAAVLLWFAAVRGTGAGPWAAGVGTAVMAAAVALVGVPAATRVARESGREDPGFVVIDEVAGQLVALIAVPADWKHALLSLLLFRALDIAKPPPIRQLERLPEGWGIMLDDVAAGLLALLAASLLRLWLP